ncbi:MAG TPA: DUF2653 family protein [Pseudogracilibacillus sp.]|nr:DUF2653 family protein [Pseudogracilibacillus sp.]
MEQLTLFEQDLINALCLYHARYKHIAPDEVEVELIYDEISGYSADVFVDGQMMQYDTSNFIKAIRMYLDEELSVDPMSARISFEIDRHEGMIAQIL